MKDEAKSAIQEIAGMFKHYEKFEREVYNHLLIGIDCDNSGRPISKVLKSQAPPMELLGMIDTLMMMLTEARKEVRAKISEQDKISRLVSRLPEPLGSKIKDLEMRMRAAAERLDKDEMNRIQKELDELIDGSKGNIMDFLKGLREDRGDRDGGEGPGDEDFNIKDFLGGV